MKSPESKLDERELMELKRAANKAIKHVLDLARHEPVTILISGNAGNEADCPVDEIAEWLFERRQDNGNTDN